MSGERKLKKRPEDYPLFQFRLRSGEDKNELDALVEEVYARLNEDVSKDEKKIKRNEILVEALKRGLKSMRGRK